MSYKEIAEELGVLRGPPRADCGTGRARTSRSALADVAAEYGDRRGEVNATVTCQQVLDALYTLIDCEECDQRTTSLTDASRPRPHARTRGRPARTSAPTP